MLDLVFVNFGLYKVVIEVLRSIGKVVKIIRYGYIGFDFREWFCVIIDGFLYFLVMSIIDSILICMICVVDRNIE